MTAVVLAGGRARRMGGEDKGLIEVAGKPMVAHAVDALRPQAAEVVVNANRNAGAYRTMTGCRVIADTVGNFSGGSFSGGSLSGGDLAGGELSGSSMAGRAAPCSRGILSGGSLSGGSFAGPLAGMASALEASATRLLLTAPCDSPLVAPDLGPRLHAALVRGGAEIAVAHDGERMQPVFALIARSVLPSLLAFFDEGGRKIDLWYATRHTVNADFSDAPDTFLNVNTPEERERLERRLARHGAGRG